MDGNELNEVWALIGNGAGIVAVICIIIFVRYISEQDKRSAEEREKNSEERIATHQKFCETIKDITDKLKDSHND